MTIAATVDAEAAAIVRAATKPPRKNALPWWMSLDNLPPNAIHCGAHGPFCAYCPEEPPCVRAGVTTLDCEDCTPENRIEWCGKDACPCRTRVGGQRLNEFRKWKAKHDRANGITDQRRSIYGRRRWAAEKSLMPRNRAKEHNYRLGRTCSECGKPITDRGKSGMCQTCTRQNRPWRLDTE